MFKSGSKPSQVFRTIFPCRLTAQHKKRKQAASGTADYHKSSASNDKISFASLNDEENDLYWSEEPLKDHVDAEDKKHVGIAGSFPYALGFGDLGRNKRRKKNGGSKNNHDQYDANADVNDAGTPATVMATPSAESTSWAAEFNRRFPSPSSANDETRWIDAAVDKTNNAFSAQKPQHGSNVAQQDAIGEMHQQHATASDSEEDMFDANAVRMEPKRRLFGASGGDAPSFATPTGVMDREGNVIVSSSMFMGANAVFSATSSQGSAISNASPGSPEAFTASFPIQAISPSQRDTVPKSSTRKTREQQRQRRTARRNRRRQRHKDLVDVVSKISEKCSELQINLAEKEADIDKLRGSHEALLRDLEKTGSSPAFASNIASRSHHMGMGGSAGGTINRGTTMNVAHAYNNVGNDQEKKVLQTCLSANAKLEAALKAMQDTAQDARKTLDRTKKDHEVEINQLRRTHEVALNEQRGAYTKTLQGMQQQLTTANQQVQHLQNRNYDLEMQLDCAKAALQEESTQRAQENLNHVYEMMDLTRDHEARVAELKKEKAALAEQVEEGYLNMDEMRMSLELVKADADYASAKLERTKRAHRDEIRSLTQESDDRFFKIMAARERECQGMNQELNGMFGGGGFGSMQSEISKSSSKFD